jgi:hypothetical protein
MKTSLSGALAYIGVVALVVCLVSTFIAFWLETRNSNQWPELTKALLSWKVVVGALGAGAGVTFREAIAKRIAGAPGKTS